MYSDNTICRHAPLTPTPTPATTTPTPGNEPHIEKLVDHTFLAPLPLRRPSPSFSLTMEEFSRGIRYQDLLSPITREYPIDMAPGNVENRRDTPLVSCKSIPPLNTTGVNLRSESVEDTPIIGTDVGNIDTVDTLIGDTYIWNTPISGVQLGDTNIGDRSIVDGQYRGTSPNSLLDSLLGDTGHDHGNSPAKSTSDGEKRSDATIPPAIGVSTQKSNRRESSIGELGDDAFVPLDNIGLGELSSLINSPVTLGTCRGSSKRKRSWSGDDGDQSIGRWDKKIRRDFSGDSSGDFSRDRVSAQYVSSAINFTSLDSTEAEIPPSDMMDHGCQGRSTVAKDVYPPSNRIPVITIYDGECSLDGLPRTSTVQPPASPLIELQPLSDVLVSSSNTLDRYADDDLRTIEDAQPTESYRPETEYNPRTNIDTDDFRCSLPPHPRDNSTGGDCLLDSGYNFNTRTSNNDNNNAISAAVHDYSGDFAGRDFSGDFSADLYDFKPILDASSSLTSSPMCSSSLGYPLSNAYPLNTPTTHGSMGVVDSAPLAFPTSSRDLCLPLDHHQYLPDTKCVGGGIHFSHVTVENSRNTGDLETKPSVPGSSSITSGELSFLADAANPSVTSTLNDPSTFAPRGCGSGVELGVSALTDHSATSISGNSISGNSISGNSTSGNSTSGVFSDISDLVSPDRNAKPAKSFIALIG